MATKSGIQTKINGRIDNGGNSIQSERSISQDFLDELFSIGDIDDYQTEAFTTQFNILVSYTLQFKKIGNQVFMKLNIRNIGSTTISANEIVSFKLFNWKDSKYTPTVFNNFKFPVYGFNSTIIAYCYINNIGIYLVSSLQPASALIPYFESTIIPYLVREL